MDDKVAVVTGAGSGIGQAIALLFARQGARVKALDLGAEAAAETVARARAAGGLAEALSCDVSDPVQVRAAISAVDARHGRLGPGRVPWGVTLLFVLAVVVWGILQYTRFGRHLLAIGSNERTARLCGVPVERSLVAVYTIAAALAGLAGVLQFSKLAVGDPVVAIGLELDVVAAVIIGGGSLSGGKGSVAGTLAGAALMVAVNVGCTHVGVPNWVQQILTGLIIVVAVALDRFCERAAAA